MKLKLKRVHNFSNTKEPNLTLVFLHGIASNSSTWDKATNFLEGTRSMNKNVRFLSFDWLGFGKSKKGRHFEYNYEEQLTALENSLKKEVKDGPVILVAHSMGTLLAAKYAETHKKQVKHLILVSPAVFSREEIKFLTKPGNNAFYKKIDQKWLKNRAFTNSMQNIVMNISNQKTFENLTTKTDLIYGKNDIFISQSNLKKLAKTNKKYLKCHETTGRHSITRDKYVKILEILEKELNEII